MNTTCLRRRILAVSATLLVAAIAAAAPALSQEATPETAEPRLGIAPVGYDGSWFDLEIAPGASQHLSVELANHGDQPIDARTYAADVYTLIGGGMGVALRDSAASGSTEWVDYPTATLELDPDEGERRTVTVAVPDDATPGQYIAALVIENDQPLRAEGALSVERVTRQALAINITVPGPPRPSLAIGQARHTDPGGRSVVLLGVDNTGDRHLRPAGRLTLTGPSGDTVASTDLEMDIHFAGTATEVELNLDHLLAPGTYTLAAELRDDEYDIEVVGSAQFEVVAPPKQGSPIPGRDRLEDALRDAGLPTWLVLVAAGLFLLLPVVLIVVVVRGLRRSRRDVTGPAGTTADERPGAAGVPDPPRSMASAPPTLPPPPASESAASPGAFVEDHRPPNPPAPDPELTRALFADGPRVADSGDVQAVGTGRIDPVDLSRFTARTAPKRSEQRTSRRRIRVMSERRGRSRPDDRRPGLS